MSAFAAAALSHEDEAPFLPPSDEVLPQPGVPEQHRIGVLLFNLGGPDSLETVRPFLRNLFADKDIIPLPGPQWLQNVFAWRVSKKREKEARHNYQQIGGRSPIEPLTRQQAELLQQALAQRGVTVSTYLAMRYWHPRVETAIEQMRADGITQLVLLPLYPHYSLATTGSSMRELNRLWPTLNDDVAVSTVCAYYDYPTYLRAMADTIQQGLDQHSWSCALDDVTVLFSAHGLPVSYVKKNRDPYPKHIRATAEKVMAQYFPRNHWQICYQSKVGPMQWLTPYTEDLLPQLAQEGRDNVLLVPISFVSDHIETLYELDLLYIPQARAAGMTHCHRAPALNDNPLFIQALAELVLQTLSTPYPCRIRWPQQKPSVVQRPLFLCGYGLEEQSAAFTNRSDAERVLAAVGRAEDEPLLPDEE